MNKYLIAGLLACSVSLAAQTPLERAVTIQSEVNALVAILAIPPPIDVAPGDNLQAALDGAPAGAVIRLTAGASYPGTVILRTNHVTLTTTATLPIGRIDPSNRALLPKLQNVLTAAGVHHVSLVGLEVTNSGSDLVRLGDGAQTLLSQVPHDLLVDRCYIHGDATLGAKRGIALNSGNATIRQSYISDIKAVGQDAQAIGGWNGPGPYLITDNYLEGSTENVMFGGADPAIPNLVPADITVTGNTLNKPVAWRTQSWQVKNLFELKNARRVTVDGNTLTNSWGQAQVGYAFVLTPRNQDGNCPWCTIEDVVISNNTVSHVAAAVDIQGADDLPKVSGRTSRVRIVSNAFTDVDPWAYAGSDKLYLILGGPVDVTFDHNTAVGQHIGSVVSFDGTPKSLRLAFTNNTWPASLYGIKGSGQASGQASWDAYVDTGVLSGNVIQ